LVSNKAEIPILKYVKQIDLIQRGVLGDIETYGFDKGKFKLVKNDRHANALGSIILQLKRRKIPFAFFDNMADWAQHRGEYSYIGDKKVSIDSRPGYSSKQSYNDLHTLLECLSDKPYDDLGNAAQKMCRHMLSYPSDIASVFNDYENFRKPDANPTLRTVTLKISRVLLRRGLTTKEQAGKFIADKAARHYDDERKKDEDAFAKEVAPLIAAALTTPMSEWPESKNTRISPKSMFGNISDRFSYLFDDAENQVERVLKSTVPEVAQLRKTMKALDLADASDVVSHIYYTYVKK
jgi:hypothetical protein